MIKRLLLLALILASLAASLPAYDIEYPMLQAFVTFPFTRNQALQAGSFGIDWKVGYANVMTRNFALTRVCDLEYVANTFSFAYGVSDRLTLDLHLRFYGAWGGFLDAGIEGFHNLFGLPPAGRDQFARNQVHYWFDDAFRYTADLNGVAPLVVSALVEPWRGEHYFVSTRLALTLPLVSKPGFASDKPAATIGLSAGYKIGAWSFETADSLTFFAAPSWLPDGLVGNSLFCSDTHFTVGWFTLGFILRTSPFRSLDIAKTGYLFYFGFRISPAIEIGLSEDTDPYQTTPDVGFFVKIKLAGN
jgi:hypothetical protein